ncbi:hypothetical protein EVAR_10424_1 [Eumeta japonica]|uniref:Uncharacterized protein n=1 Tax=Eumeta variegata TaxID=151549 RepID=A0A4C1UDK1_EUMVA|nr:hypothetical protein EVAR_10424_1 [Eumeta japonica]
MISDTDTDPTTADAPYDEARARIRHGTRPARHDTAEKKKATSTRRSRRRQIKRSNIGDFDIKLIRFVSIVIAKGSDVFLLRLSCWNYIIEGKYIGFPSATARVEFGLSYKVFTPTQPPPTFTSPLSTNPSPHLVYFPISRERHDQKVECFITPLLKRALPRIFVSHRRVRKLSPPHWTGARREPLTVVTGNLATSSGANGLIHALRGASGLI